MTTPVYVIAILLTFTSCISAQYGYADKYPANTASVYGGSQYYHRSFVVTPEMISNARYAQPNRYRYEPARSISRRRNHPITYPTLNGDRPRDAYLYQERPNSYQDRIGGRYGGRSYYHEQPTVREPWYGTDDRPAPIYYNTVRRNYAPSSAWRKMRYEVERSQVRQAVQTKMYKMKREIENCEADLSNCAYNAEELVDKIYEYEKIRGRLPKAVVPDEDDSIKMTIGGTEVVQFEDISELDESSSRDLCVSFCARNKINNEYSITCRSYLYNLNFKLMAQRRKMMKKCYDCRAQCPDEEY